MDEEKRVQQMENAEERDAFERDRTEDEFHEDEPAVMETEEEYREREAADMEADEEIRHREPAARELEEKIREREPSAMEKELLPLLDGSEAEEFRSRWLDIQTDFVDDPRHSVENADELVARVINSITENFANERTSLEDQWNRGEEASTEDLRLAMKRYRSFFNRLLTLETSTVEE
jgi:hypothetical protein